MTFLDKLKRKIAVEENKIDTTKVAVKEGLETKKSSDFAQLDVNIYQTSSKFVIIAVIPGVDINSLDISVENENDVVTLRGKKEPPKEEVEEKEKKEYLHQECQWGEFYRQIILPQEVNVSKIEARKERGTLIVKLPLLRLRKKGSKIVIKSSD